MSDEFDKRRPPDDDSEDDLPEWQRNKPGTPGASDSSGKTGYTGELSWRQNIEDAFNDQLDQSNDDAFDWQQTQQGDIPTSSSGSTGYTGELDWKKLQSSQSPAGSDSDDDALDWLTASEEPEPAAPPPSSSPASWLNDDDDELPAAAPEDNNDPLAWMRDFGDDDLLAEEPEPIDQPSSGMSASWLDDENDELPADEPEDDSNSLAWMRDFEDDEPAEESEPIVSPLPEFEDDLEAEDLSDSQLAWLQQYQAPEDAVEEDDSEPLAMEFDEPELDDLLSDMPPIPQADMPDWLNQLNAPEEDEDEPAPNLEAGQDWFASFGDGDDEQDEPAQADMPDWLAASAPPAASAPAPSGDIFAELGLESPETGYDFLDQQPEEESNALDWFAEQEAEAEAEAEPDWLSQIGEIDTTAVAESAPDMPTFDDDFFAGMDDSAPAASIDPLDTAGLQDIDSLLASYEAELPGSSNFDSSSTSVDFDRLLSSEELEQISARRAPQERGGPELSPDAPDWLSELGANVDQVSAASIVRRQAKKERSLDDLPERLQALHDRGLELPAPTEDAPNAVLRTLLPGVTEVLPAAPIKTGLPGLVGTLALTDEQRDKIKLLQAMVGIEADTRRSARQPSAIDLTLAAPDLADLADDEPIIDLETATPLQASAARTRRRPKIDRLIVTLVVALAVILPYFVGGLRIGNLPPARFAAGGHAQNAFDRIDALQPGQLALIAAEYGPTSAAELDSALDALLRHVLAKGARPVLVSGNAIGLLHAQNVLEGLASDTSFREALGRSTQLFIPNSDYVVARYLAGEIVGLRAFSQDLGGLLAVDVTGLPTGLSARSLNDFGVIALIAENAEDARAWAEQVTPLTNTPLVVAVSQSAAPLAEPYVIAQSPARVGEISGMIVGYRDAYTYRTQVDALIGGTLALPPVLPTETTPEPTVEAPIIEITDEATEEATIETVTAEASETEDATATRQPSNTPTEEATEAATNTPRPTATEAEPTRTPTERPSATPSPSPTPLPIILGVVDAGQAVNVREGPGRTSAAIGSVTPGTVIQVIGRNGDGDWLQIRLEDGTEGWISADFVAVEGPSTPTPEGGAMADPNAYAGLMVDVNFVAFYQPETTAEATAEATGEVTAEATEAVSQPTTVPAQPTIQAVAPVSNLPTVDGYRDQRWYGMTLGLIAIILIITLGAVINILRAIFSRRKQS